MVVVLVLVVVVVVVVVVGILARAFFANTITYLFLEGIAQVVRFRSSVNFRLDVWMF